MSMEGVHEALGRLARRQHGLITELQGTGAGLTEAGIKWLVHSQRWERLFAGVYRVNGSPETWQSRVLGACLAAGLGALVSHRSAAALWELEGFLPPGVVDLTVPADRVRLVDGARLRRSRDLALAGRAIRQGVPVTGLARTPLDLCAVERNPDIALRALDDARRRKLVTWPELRRCLALHARRGRPGVRAFRALVELRDGKEPSHGVFELLLRKTLLDAGLPEPEAQVWVALAGCRYRLDLAYRNARLGIECDGREAHLNERAFEEDPVRENRLKLAGWLILRYTWRRLEQSPEGVAREVGAALSSRQAG